MKRLNSRGRFGGRSLKCPISINFSMEFGGEGVRLTIQYRGSLSVRTQPRKSLKPWGLFPLGVRPRPFPVVQSRAIFGDQFGDQSERQMSGRLTARKVATAKPGKYSDGGNLYLIVSITGSRKWVLRFTWRGAAKEMGLGSASNVPLADAREKAADARRTLAKGLNPIDERKRGSGIPTFGEMADIVCETLAAGFRSAKHKGQWKNTLQRYAAPLRDQARRYNRNRGRIGCAKTDLGCKAGNRLAPARSNREGPGRGEGKRPPKRRKPGTMARSSRPLLPRPLKLTRGHHAAMAYDQVPRLWPICESAKRPPHWL